jgi:galactose mutarotase-like enzyme
MIWNADPAFWARHSPVLFPIVGTLKNDTYRYNSKQYLLSRHGFARDMEFQPLNQSDDSITFLLTENEATLKVYPFHFELQLIYTLIENSLCIHYKVFNKSSEILYFSIGAHPAFALSGKFEDYTIRMEQQEKLQYHLLENDLISEKTGYLNLKNKDFDLDYDLFKNDALVFKHLKSKSLTILQKQKPLLKVNFKEFPYLGIWTKAGAPFICIEPWFGYSDTSKASGNLPEKDGIQTLSSNSQFDAKFSIEVF